MVLIIGASSFIGVHTVAKFLSEGCKVAVTGRKNKFNEHYDKLGVDYYNLDLANKDDFEKLLDYRKMLEVFVLGYKERVVSVMTKDSSSVVGK